MKFLCLICAEKVMEQMPEAAAGNECMTVERSGNPVYDMMRSKR